MFKEVCEHIHKIDTLIKLEVTDVSYVEYDDMLKSYCPLKKNYNTIECFGYDEIVSAAFIFFLENFNSSNDEEKFEGDKLAEYAILWLSYKLNQNPQKGITTVYDLYTKHIEKNTNYNQKIIDDSDDKISKKHINKKLELMSMEINVISKFYEALQILCNMYDEDKEKNPDCTKCSQYAEEFVKSFKKLNEDPNVAKDSPYYQVWLTLSNDYDNLKKKCGNCQSINLPTLPSIKLKKISPPNSVESYGKTPIDNSVHISDVTTSNSSIASKLIPILLIFSIPIFLGIAYKYSLFGFDKRVQRQNFREKLKKIKKKLNHYI
ncbi:CIR protein [Plasmodium chabaudi chabaudi]|uniref:CIR protein n=1 Tax=Plasmodium chabaudi chabaudi TaxID=31271 RepID=A0A4V0K284_PLACU|nr:CIR protein [Plasmodium chabaudi chabaudi]VTZ66927.1 CIR protein [Plasmodium chabaudi chabaudi]|eukprot:XP_016653133.1 CIR protein [Plasmodium chabaudi chabaudi]